MLPYLDNLGLHLLVFLSYLDRYYTMDLFEAFYSDFLGSVVAENQLLYGAHII